MSPPFHSANRQAHVPRYLYIVSLERSGSTTLTFNLGLRPGFAALGEIDRTLELMARPGGFSGRDCSCGATIPNCPVWAPVGRESPVLAAMGVAERYQRLDALLEPVLGADTVVVDGSKPLATLQAIRPVFDERLFAVHLVKDVRAYLESTLRRMATMDQERLWAEALKRQPLRARLVRALPDSLVYLLRWTRQNRAIRDWLAGQDMSWLRIGYETLCAEPDAWLNTMAKLADTKTDQAQHHILLGSFGYLDSDRPKTLTLDKRWHRSPRRRLLDVAHSAVAGLNRELAEPFVHHASSARSITT